MMSGVRRDINTTEAGGKRPGIMEEFTKFVSE